MKQHDEKNSATKFAKAVEGLDDEEQKEALKIITVFALGVQSGKSKIKQKEGEQNENR
uniref:Uncharacterized protein n=1 Tax=Siphoviridae sp. ctGuJ10 TaxID=2825418 RepID=A0A8S5PU97_9CAUD|nr:MAG TPA: hypothetical protein [Siphoviridae sp. ctGuJ10]